MSQGDKGMVFFVVWVMNKAARAWNRIPCEVYRTLQDAGIVRDYLIDFYDTFHTMGELAILDDLTSLAATGGVTL